MTNPNESLTSEPVPVRASPAVRIVAAVSTLLWLFMSLIGISGVEGVRDQHVPGFPNDGQLRLYVVVPLIGLASSAAILVFAERLPKWAKRTGVTISFLVLLPVFMIFGGGV
jgi:hypothetical protein